MKQTSKLLSDWSFGWVKQPPPIYNPQQPVQEKAPKEIQYHVLNYDKTSFESYITTDETTCEHFVNDAKTTWIHVIGINNQEVDNLCKMFGVHPLVVEDILSEGQRAKIDEIEDVFFVLMPILKYNINTAAIEIQQLSIVLGKDFVLSFQDNKDLDIFDAVTKRVKKYIGKSNKHQPDFLAYNMIDLLVDSYFSVLEQINNKIENIEDDMLHRKEQRALNKITYLRRELMTMYRNMLPVRDALYGILKSDNPLLIKQHEKYFKDVLDHIIQATEHSEGQREMLMSIHDLLMSQINLKMNQVMKTFTMVATLLAPATVIGGIFGMNFSKIPLQDSSFGFTLTVSLMLLIPILMLYFFKRKGWF